MGLILGLGRSPGEGNGYLLQYSGLENSMDRGAWWATVKKLHTHLQLTRFHRDLQGTQHAEGLMLQKHHPSGTKPSWGLVLP